MLKRTESEILLHEIEQLLKPIIRKATYVEYGVKSKPETNIPANQITMNYKEFVIKIEVTGNICENKKHIKSCQS